ncbi:helix-turn-helix domain-containing protein [Flavobacterium sp.]|uniref:helix-turn-helix domain-containing protein n=1 Tax=Flavobacterium sp. TaxID=239 RepID=UPI004047B6A3
MISEQEYINNLGIRIRQLREERNISQQMLADMCNMPKSSIGRVERGKVSVTIKSLIKISNAFEIELIQLFSFKSNSN